MSVLVGRQAPDFTVPAVLADGTIAANFNLKEALRGKYGVIFFYPLDFTFVCPSELIALDHAIERFKQLNTLVVGVSIDSQFTHHAWRKTPIAEGGIGPVKYTLAADVAHTICRSYGVENEGGLALRGTFVIDRQNIVRSQIVNDLPLGRNIAEIIRLLEAIQFHEANGEVCPANWNKGDIGMKASPEGVAKYLAENVDRL